MGVFVSSQVVSVCLGLSCLSVIERVVEKEKDVVVERSGFGFGD